MSSIHGLSHKALKYFRKKPATLAVYWIYVSRTNNEGVAWPTIRGLKRDTGWSADSCVDARAWLVKHEALEKINGYVQPSWRGLDDKTRAQRVNLDQSEYYRPTGYIVVDDVKYSMLYFGAMEASDIESEGQGSAHVRRHRTSTAPNNDAIDQRPDRTELDSSISDLGTSNTKLDPINTNPPAPIGTDPRPESVPVVIDVVKAANQVVDEAINKTRKQNPNQATHDELLACFGLTPETVTKTGDKTYWIATADLASIHFPVEAIKPLHKWCMAQNWPSLTVMAMAKYAGQFLVTWKQPAPSNNPAHKRVIVPDEPEGDPAQLAMIAATLKAVSDKWLVSDRNKNGR